VLFSAFLGYNPIQQLVGAHTLGALSAHSQAVLTGRSFFPQLISAPFRSGLHVAFGFAVVACLVAGAASLMRGGVYIDAGGAAARTDRSDAAAGGSSTDLAADGGVAPASRSAMPEAAPAARA
jgi:hypothetical protein